ncbi:MAG: amidohydrolase [Caldisericia bacterium]|nr:amidohydrolase [Caldisericia bacterium]
MSNSKNISNTNKTISPSELRMWMQKNPESAFNEYKITQLLITQMKNQDKIALHMPTQTGLLVSYEPRVGSPFILFRCDIDALPNGTNESKTLDECKHLCGHDVHTSIMWGFLQSVLKSNVDKNILFLFQPGEESGDGARRILKSDILSKWEIEKCIALHVNDAYPIGSIASNDSTLFAASQEIDIILQGLQSHITLPEKGIDALKASVEFITRFQNSEKIEGTFLGIGKLNTGTTRNSISDTAQIFMTARANDKIKLQKLIQQIKDILSSIESNTGIKWSLKKGSSCPAVKNNKALFDHYYSVLSTQFPFINTKMVLAAEDFGYFSDKFPSFMFWLGTREINQKAVGLHHNDFHPSNNVIPLGIKAFQTILNS